MLGVSVGEFQEGLLQKWPDKNHLALAAGWRENNQGNQPQMELKPYFLQVFFSDVLVSGAWICQSGVWICQLGVWIWLLGVLLAQPPWWAMGPKKDPKVSNFHFFYFWRRASRSLDPGLEKLQGGCAGSQPDHQLEVFR